MEEKTNKSNKMELKHLLDTDFGLDLPITGGNGNSIDNPIVITEDAGTDYVSIEYCILRCLGIGRGLNRWNLLRQTLMVKDGRHIDQMKIETEWYEGDQVITQVENYYFDIEAGFSLIRNKRKGK